MWRIVRTMVVRDHAIISLASNTSPFLFKPLIVWLIELFVLIVEWVLLTEQLKQQQYMLIKKNWLLLWSYTTLIMQWKERNHCVPAIILALYSWLWILLLGFSVTMDKMFCHGFIVSQFSIHFHFPISGHLNFCLTNSVFLHFFFPFQYKFQLSQYNLASFYMYI